MRDFTSPLPETRATGGTDPADPAVDVNALSVALAEVRAVVPETAEDVGAQPTGDYVTTTVADSTYAPASVAAAAGFTGDYMGAWAGSTVYAAGKVVTVEGGLVRCLTPHTSNGAGFRYDREKWEPVPLPVLAADTLVPVRALTSSTGVAGVTQRSPRQFDYSRERVLWAIDAAADLTMSGAHGGVVTGALPGGSAVITSAAASTSKGYAQAAVLAAPVDLTGTHLRVPIKVSQSVNRWFSLELTSAGTDFTSRLTINVMAGNNDGTRTGQVEPVSLPISEFTVTGTPNVAAINGARFVTENGSGGQFTAEVSRITYLPNPTGKAKVTIWFDDGFANQLDAIKILARYGYPFVIAAVAENFGTAFTLDQVRYMQDVLGAQVAVHAYGPSDHNRAQDDLVALRQMLAYQHLGAAEALHGVEDFAYFNTGLNAPDTASKDLVVRKLFRSARGGRSRLPETLPPGNPMFTRAWMTGSSNTAATHYIPYVQRAIACGGLAQFVWHQTAGADLTELEALCVWLDANRSLVDVVTPATAFAPYCR